MTQGHCHAFYPPPHHHHHYHDFYAHHHHHHHFQPSSHTHHHYLSIFTLTITILTLTLTIFLTSPPSQGNLTIAEALLEGGADPNLCDEAQGKTPLHHAAYWGHLAVLQLLLDKGALVNSKVGALVRWGGGGWGLDREWVGLGGVATGAEGL